MESTGTRQLAVPIKVLEVQHDFATEKLEKLCNEDITEYSDNIEKLRELARDAKKLHFDYDSISKKLFEKYNASGAVYKAEEVRSLRQLKRKDCHDFISVIKARVEPLASDDLSNIDSSSSVNSVSYRNERCVSFVNDSRQNINENNWSTPQTSQNKFEQPKTMSTYDFLDSINSTSVNTENLTMQPTTSYVYSSFPKMTETYQSNFSEPYVPSTSSFYAPHSTSYENNRTTHCTTTYSQPQISNVVQDRDYSDHIYNSNKYHNQDNLHRPNMQYTERRYEPFIPPPPRTNIPPPPRTNIPPLNHQQQSLIHEINKITLDPFDGSAHSFWSWFGRIQQKINSAPLNPLQILLLLQENTTGAPRKMVKDHILSRGEITDQDVTEICRLLKQRYGSSSKISDELMSKLKQFPSIRGINQGIQLQSLYDLCKIINFNIPHNSELQFLNISEGLKLVRSKLPEKIQEEWRLYGQRYKEEYYDNHPPFSVFIKFLERKANELADNDFAIYYTDPPRQYKKAERVMKTNTNVEPNYTSKYVQNELIDTSEKVHCVLHDKPGHSLSECKAFEKLPLPDKKKKVFELKVCFRCLGSHFISNCQAKVKCDICNKEHMTIMHDPDYIKKKTDSSSYYNKDHQSDEKKRALCMTLCSDPNLRKNCSKVVLVDLSMPSVPDKVLRAYVILDDQSNTSLVDEKLVHFFGKEFPKRDYTLNFASQKFEMSETGYLVTGLEATCINTKKTIKLPQLLSTTEIANTKHEVADPTIVRAHPHLKHLASNFNEYDEQAEVLMLIGRDCGDAMLCENYSKKEPYAYKTPLGWALVGETCILDKHQQPRRTLRTAVCSPNHVITRLKVPPKNTFTSYSDPFEVASDDDEPGLSRNDKKFLEIMSDGATINDQGSIQLPIPFHNDANLPNNKKAVFHRTKNTLARLQKQPEQLQSCLDTIKMDIERGSIEQVPPDELDVSNDLTWWLPIFTVYNPKKNKTRMVYDASAKYYGKSLNDCMIQGPDFNNTLRGVLLRFRENQIGFISDVEKMFNSFSLPPEQKDCYRFFWFKDNDPSQDLHQYRSTCHIFGSRSSPAIANFGLKYTVTQPIAQQYPEAIPFIENGFYVDDGIYSASTTEEAVTILNGSIKILRSFNIRLHKIWCSSPEVLKEFPSSELATGTHLLEKNENCSTRTLGVGWDPHKDCFYLRVQTPDRPFTKRGIISIVNSLYDPIGMVSPIVLTGRLIQRAVLSSSKESNEESGWDDILPEAEYSNWRKWVSSLCDIEKMKINRCFLPKNFEPVKQELHVYADASEKAIGLVSYIRSCDAQNNIHVSFVEGNSRVAPRAATTMPRMELCAAVEASHATFKIMREFSRKPDSVYFYSDSQITLGYIANTEKRFTNYVTRRVNTILKYSTVDQWHYISSNCNPGDLASRPQTSQDLLESEWTRGPAALWDKDYTPSICKLAAVHTPGLPEVKEHVSTLHTIISHEPRPLSKLSSKISNLYKLVNVVVILMKLLNKLDLCRQRLGISLAPRQPIMSYDICLKMLIINAQHDYFSHEIEILNAGNPLSESSKIADLSPFLDGEGILRVGGRLKKSNLSFQAKHPALLHNSHPLTTAILQDSHEYVNHQGRCLTHNAVRQRGIHILGGRKLINNFVSKCVLCRKMRGKTCEQLMADLPPDRIEDVPPFSNIGMDVFGPYLVHDGYTTRRSTASKKTWVLIIVCLVSRAVHLELLPSMDASSFINAFSRFTAVRGVAKITRTDRGTNFISGRKQLQFNDFNEAIDELQKRPNEWLLNPPGASHFAGSWERKILSIKNVLEGSFMCLRQSSLSRDELSTLLQEAAAIVNNTPLTDVSSYPDDPAPITPANLLTLKIEPNPPTLERFTQEDILCYGKKRWRRVQQLSEEFWQRWRTEYLSTLQQRQKWSKIKPNVTEGDVVLIKQKNTPRNCWPIGRIHDVKLSEDGLIRSVTLKLPALSGSIAPRYTTKCIHDLVIICSSHK